MIRLFRWASRLPDGPDVDRRATTRRSAVIHLNQALFTQLTEQAIHSVHRQPQSIGHLARRTRLTLQVGENAVHVMRD